MSRRQATRGEIECAWELRRIGMTRWQIAAEMGITPSRVLHLHAEKYWLIDRESREKAAEHYRRRYHDRRHREQLWHDIVHNMPGDGRLAEYAETVAAVCELMGGASALS